MAFIDGDDPINGSLFSFEEWQRMKNNWRGAAAPANIQPGMLFSDSDDDELYMMAAALQRILKENSLGRVGIGTTVPGAKLTIDGGGGTSSITGLVIQNQGSGATKAIDLSNTGMAVSWTKYILYAGIGQYWDTFGKLVTTYLAALYFESPANTNMNFRPSAANGGAGYYISINYFNGIWQDAVKVANVASGYSNLQLMPAGGNVGIGTTIPSEKLEIVGNLKISAGKINIICLDNNVVCIDNDVVLR